MFAFLPGTRSFVENENAKILRTVSLEDGVNITALPEDTILMEYRAPNGVMEIYRTPTETGALFDIGIGWKTVTDGASYREMHIEK